MFESPQSVADGETLEFDICLAGAGAAGLTMALELEGCGLRVCLLEAGGFEAPKLDEDHPYVGENVGRPYSLTATRLSYFGGTTNVWAGYCGTLDEVDFLGRAYIPLSGWPIKRPDLDSYYRRAGVICELDPDGIELSELRQVELPEEELYHTYDEEFVVKNLRFSPPTNFGKRYRGKVESSQTVKCFLNSTVVEIEQPEEQVSRFRVQAGEKVFYVKAGVYVIALGAIENARLLLDSDRFDKRGVGNGSDFVGRCFTDHPGKTVGRLLTSSRGPYVSFVQDGIRVMPYLSLGTEAQLKYEIGNFGVVFPLVDAEDELLGLDYLADEGLFSGWKGSREMRILNAQVGFEPTPNPESRVLLSEERDPNGMRRVRLDWRLSQFDFESLDKIAELLGRKAGLTNFGRFRRTHFSAPAPSEEQVGFQCHHMGTTRMSEDPAVGVVDADCRVHATQNLFVAGSSVFPTFGCVNPTLTIVALASRLAEYLKGNFKAIASV